MNGQPLMTVLVRSHRYWPFVERGLTSLLGQSFYKSGQMEVVVLQDGREGTDARRTWEKIRMFERTFGNRRHDNFRFEYVEPPVGHAGICNRGLDLARGYTIAYLDSDDIVVDSNHYRRIYNALLQSKANIVSANCTRVYFNNDSTPRIDRASESLIVTDENYKDLGALICMRRDDARRIRYREGLTLAEDFAFLVDCEAAGFTWAPAVTPPESLWYVQHLFARDPEAADRRAAVKERILQERSRSGNSRAPAHASPLNP